MKIFSLPRPGLLSGLLAAATILVLLTMRVKGDISLLATAVCIVLIAAFWAMSTFVVGCLRGQNLQYQRQIQDLWRRIHARRETARVVPPDDRRDTRRVPHSVQLFWEKYPEYK